MMVRFHQGTPLQKSLKREIFGLRLDFSVYSASISPIFIRRQDTQIKREGVLDEDFQRIVRDRF